MKIAVVLVNYNGISDTLDCIESLRNSAVPLKVIVIDNASKNDESYLICQKHPDVKTFRLEQNLGFAGGNNVGIEWALENDYEYIALLNNDTVIDSKLFENLQAEAAPDTVVAPYMYFHSSPDDLWYGGGNINRWTGNATHIYVPNENLVPFECTLMTGCCFMAHRDVWKKVGLLDDSYFMYNEDTDFSIRLMQNGIKLKVVPQAKLWHKVGKSSGGETSPLSCYYITRNRLHLLKTYKSFFKPTAYLFTIVTRYLWVLRMLKAGKRDSAQAFLQGIKDFKQGITGAAVIVSAMHQDLK